MRTFMATPREIPGLAITIQINKIVLSLLQAFFQGVGLTLGFLVVRGVFG